MKKRFTEEQIIGLLREVDSGLSVKDMCRRHGFSEASYYLWRSKFSGMDVPPHETRAKYHAEKYLYALRETTLHLLHSPLWKVQFTQS